MSESSGGARSARAPRLNAICPYFTMFPYSFPERVLAHLDPPPGLVLDPFCGRGTTNLAARARGYATVGMDANPLAVALTAAKLVETTPERIKNQLRELERNPVDVEVPSSEFWRWAFAPNTLLRLTNLRAKLSAPTENPERIALRALIAGALHGPINMGSPSYLSNQAPRTFAPKPRYALKFWRSRNLRPREVDIAEIVERRANWYYNAALPAVRSSTILGDARSLSAEWLQGRVDTVVTSPPYWQMRTYKPDQWLRLWFLGGPEDVEY
ncbi:MAG: DNA methyltransferase, partial [Rhodothermales bacterium]